MSFHEDFDDLHENCVPVDDVVSHVIENDWDEVQRAVDEVRGQEWLESSKPCIDLLSIISRRDREHTRSALNKRLRKKPTSGDELSDDQLFSVAADVAEFLEALPTSRLSQLVLHGITPGGYQGTRRPTVVDCIALSAPMCTLGDDLSWAKDLLVVTRAFRDFLAALSDGDLPRQPLQQRIDEPIQVLNNYLRKAPAEFLVYWHPREKELNFGRCPSPESTGLASFIASWISSYLESHYAHVGLGVCSECGKFFDRERRDKAFCSKTCQNRVAYRRKKILESGALGEVNIAPDDACSIPTGLWMHHPRYGIGCVVSVTNGYTGMISLIDEGPTTSDTSVRYRSMLSRRVTVEVGFLHGVRKFGYADLFEGQKREDQLPTFYEVKSEETLAELL